MTKAPKKAAATPSWRTLMRRAKNMKLPPAERMQLREQASSLRRAERKAVKKKKAIKSGGLAAFVASAPEAALQGINRTPSSAWQNAIAAAETPGRGDTEGWQAVSGPGGNGIVGGKDMVDAQRITAMAKRKGGVDDVEQELKQLYRIAKYEGQRDADERHTKTVKQIHEATTDKIVCSAIAAFELQMKQQGGLPPAITISSYTLCRMLDALNRAGYSAEGRKAVGN